ncbi:MAG: beta strand repeat-containing protein, partial [Planctomycetaceae bacterium]
MRNSDWFKALRQIASSNANSPATAKSRRRHRRQPTQLSAEVQHATNTPVATEELEDRTLLSVQAELSGGVLTITLSANDDHAFVSFNSGIKVGTTDGGNDVYNGTHSATVSSVVVSNSGSFTGQTVTFSGSNDISGTDGTAATRLTSLTLTGISTLNLNRGLNLARNGYDADSQQSQIANSATGTASTVNVNSTTARIQDAISLAASGATINVAAGTYTGYDLYVNKPLTLRGSQFGVAATGTARSGGETILDGTALTSRNVVSVWADNVTIDGFAINPRVHSNNSQFARDAINVRTDHVAKPSDANIGAYRTGINIRNNWIYSNIGSRTGQQQGITFGESPQNNNPTATINAEVANVDISNNYINMINTAASGGPRGIIFTNQFQGVLAGGGNASILYTGFTITNNTVLASNVPLLQSQLRTRLNQMTITGNTFGNSRSGVSIAATMTSSVFSSNTIQDVSAGTGLTLCLVNSTANGNTIRRIAGNAFVLAGGRSQDLTYFAQSASSTISNNIITYNDTATSTNPIAGLNIQPDSNNSGTAQPGTSGVDADSIVLFGNTFTNAGVNSTSTISSLAILQRSAGKTLTALHNTPNVFGTTDLNSSATDATLYAISDLIADRVDAANLGRVYLKAASIFVTPNSFLSPSPYSTTTPSIQRGLDAAASGDTVNVQSGAYPDSTLTASTNNLTLNVSTGVTATDGSAFTTGLTLGTGVTSASLAGNLGIALTGNASNNTLTGNSGNNTITGDDGDDTITGGTGDDTIVGGNGTDTAVFPGALADYRFLYSGSPQTVRVTRLSTGEADTVSSTEILRFSDIDLYVFGAQSSYASVAAAIAAAPTSHGVLLAPASGGSAYSTISINNKNLTLVGGDPATTEINGGTASAITYSGVSAATLIGLTVTGGTTSPSTVPAISGFSPTLVNTVVVDNGVATPVAKVESGSASDTITIVNNGGVAQVIIGNGAPLVISGSTTIEIVGGNDADTVIIQHSSTNTVLPNPIVVDGGGGNDSFQLNLTGGNPVPNAGITFNGGNNDNDTLTVTLATGIAFTGVITFNGGTGGDDAIVVVGTQSTTTYGYTNPNDGSIVLSGFGTINYTGLDPITNSGTAANAVFNIPTTGNVDFVIADDPTPSSTFIRVSGVDSEFELTDLTAPTTNLTINRGAATDTVRVDDTSRFNSAASLTLGTSSDPFATATLNGTISLAGLTVYANTINSTASETVTVSTSNVFLANASTGGTLAGVIAGAGGFTKQGAATISSSAVNTYTGPTTISAGTLSLTNSGSTNSISGSTTVTIAAGATLNVSGLSSGTLVLNAGQTLTGAGTVTGAVQVAASSSLSPGTTTGTLTVDSLAFTGGTFNVDVSDATSAYDRVTVTGNNSGSVALGNGVATLAITNSHTVAAGDEIIIIQNNSSSDTTGYFVGYTEGSPITVGGQTWYISYNGGTGNDVVLRGTPQVSGTSGNDTLTLSFSSGNFRITNGTYNTVLGATLANGIVIKGGGGDDTLNLNLTGLTSVPTINFDGGAAGDDALSVSGATTTTVTHSFTNASDGSITLAGTVAGTINYLGLEPIIDNLSATDRVFTFSNVAQTIDLTDNGSAAGTNLFIDSTAGESVTFPNPSGSITIQGGSDVDTIEIESVNNNLTAAINILGGGGDDVIRVKALNTSFDANIVIDGEAGTGDSVAFGATSALTFAATRNLTVTAETITQSNALIVPGTTSLTGTAGNSITLTNAANNFGTFAVNTANNVSVLDINAIIIAASSISGNLTLNAGATTQTGAIQGAGLELLGAGPYTLTNSGNSFTTLAANTTEAISYRDTNGLIVGTVNTVGITTSDDNVTIQTGGTLAINQAVAVGTANLTLNATGAVTQAAAISGAGLELLGAGAYTLTNSGNSFTTLAANTTEAVSYRDIDGLTVGTVNTVGITTSDDSVTIQTGGTLAINQAVAVDTANPTMNATGAVTQAAAISGAGLELLGAGAYTLTNSGNSFTTLAANTTEAISYRDTNGLIVGTVNTVGITTSDDNVTIQTGGTLAINQ